MSNSHYRRLTRDLQDLMDSLTEEVTVDDEVQRHVPSEYNALASFQAVRVGLEGGGALPAHTPSRDALIAAGIDTTEKARTADMTTISGIGDATAKKIRDSLPGRAFLVQVAGPDSEELPGKFVGDDFAKLKGAAKKAVHRTRVRKTVKDEQDNDIQVEELCAEGDVPEGAEILESGINPHAFA